MRASVTAANCYIDAPPENDASLHEAIMDLPVVERGFINNHKFGWFLKKNANRFVNGMYVRKEPSTERNAWSVQLVDPASASFLTSKPDSAKARIREEIQMPDGSVMINGERY